MFKIKNQTIKFLFLISFLFLAGFQIASAQGNKDKITIFEAIGCTHCLKLDEFIQQNNLEKIFNIEKKEIRFNRQSAEEFNRLADQFNIPLEQRGTPSALIDGQFIVGDQPIIKSLKEKIKNLPLTSPNNNIINSSKKLTLPLVTGAAIVDAINPCEFAILIILLTAILTAGNKKRAFWAGLAFSLSIFISYLLMGLGAYKAFNLVGFSSWFLKFIGGLAIIIGLLNLKDYFWYGKGFIMEVPLSWRPKMQGLVKSVTSPIGALLIGFLVSLFLLPCTSGPYLIILGLLAKQETFMPALGWLVYYNLIFILPMVLITLAIYFGLDPAKAEATRQKKLELLHLIAGLIMIEMGLVILLRF